MVLATRLLFLVSWRAYGELRALYRDFVDPPLLEHLVYRLVDPYLLVTLCGTCCLCNLVVAVFVRSERARYTFYILELGLWLVLAGAVAYMATIPLGREYMLQ
jgi:hypothetical protein